MRNKKPRTYYKKPKANNKAIIATLKIVFTALVAAFIGMIGYYAATQGWEAVFGWFGGPYFCMTVIIVLIAGTIGMWLYSFVKMTSRFREDE